jgi:hypothetical protein
MSVTCFCAEEATVSARSERFGIGVALIESVLLLWRTFVDHVIGVRQFFLR